MNSIEKIIFFLISIGLFIYAYPHSPRFPSPPPGAVQSEEEADTEYEYRKAYFTDLNREEIILFYKNQFNSYPTVRLNYPPEDAQTLIRDQTRSRYLEELVHPLKESIYINGFIPTESKDDIWYKGVHYYQKITIRYIPTTVSFRLTIISFILISTLWLYLELSILGREIIKKIRKEGKNG